MQNKQKNGTQLKKRMALEKRDFPPERANVDTGLENPELWNLFCHF